MIRERDEFSLLNDSPFTAADRMIVRHLREDWGESNYWILIAAAFCSLATREGHTYLNLASPQLTSVSVPRSWPDAKRWAELVAKSRIAKIEGDDTSKPLVLCSDTNLYLDKYYNYEQTLATHLRSRSSGSVDATGKTDPVDRAAQQKFFVITGGPGTGKTTLALRYLDTLFDSWPENRPARYAAIAPTGKAAARLAESISQGVERLEINPARKEQLLAIPCLTIHRLLGALPHRSSFRKNKNHPIPFDTLVVDESSMIDLPLMLKLFEALPDRCQVLLLGDKDQLSSVEVGSVFSDILEASEVVGSALAGSVERLTKTYRFSKDSGIYQACQYARLGDAEGFEHFLKSEHTDIRYRSLSTEAKRIPSALLDYAIAHHSRLADSDDAMTALSILADSMALSPSREGPFGTVEFNRLVKSRLLPERGSFSPDDSPVHAEPIIILENDYEHELFNGDIGLVWIEGEQIMACFSNAQNDVRMFRVSELPRYESAFALTIHKSQGSEFKKVSCVFGPEQGQALTRELIYTAFSRAREELNVFGNIETLKTGIARKAVRATRLAHLLAH